mmetsp:Transcript_33642/g.65485  ORF Transcript_33642/g.65485 Transcript_33642/m.65485 type:complete len:561 (+) Transcript_33642:76-1758(+)
MQSVQYDQTVSMTFQNVEYVLHGFVDEKGHLVVEAEQRSNGARWCGRFAPRALEELTRKTGNFKKFPVFVRMLSTALLQSSDSVFVELFTYADLEALQRNAGASSSCADSARSSKSSKSRSNKRYLILTYIVEFDKVHYPLRLKFEENPDPQRLMDTIARLRDEVAAMKESQTGQPSYAKLKAENFRLQEENIKLQKMLQAKPNRRLSTQKDENLVSSLEEEILQLREDIHKRDTMIKTLMNKDPDDIEKLHEYERKALDIEEKFQIEKQKLVKKVTKLQNGLKATNRELDSVRHSEQKYRVEVRKLKAELRALGRSRSKSRKRLDGRRQAAHSRSGSRGGTSTRRKLSYARASTYSFARRSKSRPSSVGRTPSPRKYLKRSNSTKGGFSFGKSSRFPRANSQGLSRSRPSSRPGSRPGSRTGSRSGSRSNSFGGSRRSSRPSSRPSSRDRLSNSSPKGKSKTRDVGGRSRLATRNGKGSSKRSSSGGASADQKKAITNLPIRLPSISPPLWKSKASNDELKSENFDPQKEISAIDDRINALQKFLSAAKSTSQEASVLR